MNERLWLQKFNKMAFYHERNKSQCISERTLGKIPAISFLSVNTLILRAPFRSDKHSTIDHRNMKWYYILMLLHNVYYDHTNMSL